MHFTVGTGLALLAVLAKPSAASPHPELDLGARSTEGRLHARCPADKFGGTKSAKDWIDSNTSTWLDNWWNTHQDDIKKDSFYTAFTRQFLGASSEWNCKSGSTTCGTNSYCGYDDLNKLSDEDLEPAMYVLMSMTNFFNQFSVFQQAFDEAAIADSFGQEEMVKDFWHDKQLDNKGEMAIFDALGGALGFATLGFGSELASVTKSVTETAGKYADKAALGMNTGFGVARTAYQERLPSQA